MNETVFEMIRNSAGALKIDISVEELAMLSERYEFDQEKLSTIHEIFSYLAERKHTSTVETLLKQSRLPSKQPKTFDNFNFSVLRGKFTDRLKALNTLSPLYAHKNLAFIGPQGVGKTHLAMAFGYECCQREMKAYFLKASELNQRFTDARKHDRAGTVVNGLVRPSCLIIDEIGRTVFDRENTRLFFDVIDRRYSKEGPNTIIFTSNKTPSHWREYFSEDDDCKLRNLSDSFAEQNGRGAERADRLYLLPRLIFIIEIGCFIVFFF